MVWPNACQQAIFMTHNNVLGRSWGRLRKKWMDEVNEASRIWVKILI